MMKAKKDRSDALAYLALLDYRNTPIQGSDTDPLQGS